MKILRTYRHRAMLFALVAGAFLLSVHGGVVAQETLAQDGRRTPTATARLAPTAHAPLPAQLSQFWLVPEFSASSSIAVRDTSAETAATRFARGAALIAGGDYARGLPMIDTVAMARTPLAAYADYYSGVALLALARLDDADRAFAAAAARKPSGYLKEAVVLKTAEVALARLDAKRAVDALETIKNDKLSAPEEVYLQLARASERAGRRDDALKAYRRVYYEYPLSTQASDAQNGLERLETAETIPPDRFKQELGRDEKLFAAKRWAQSRAGFDALLRVAQGDDKELVALRVAECDYYLDRFRAARDGLLPYLKGAQREAEARFFHLTATRALGYYDEYVTLARKLVTDFPGTSWAEETLNNLASHYILVDDGEQADRVFRELYTQMPKSRYAERAAWKIGWRLYRNGNFLEAADLFEGAAASYLRADYRPSWLYWSGRSRDQIGDREQANERYRLAVADYQNSYYGRLSSAILAERGEAAGVSAALDSASAKATADKPTVGPVIHEPIATDGVVRSLVALELYDDALREVQYAQRVWGDSSQLQATVAFIRHNQGLTLTATDRFNALRGAINTMRRAYPQFMAAGGENLPADVLRIIFPLDFWPFITKYSQANDLDPYLVAALMAQESTFTPEIRSSANAYGLMQLMPPTGRQYARKLGMRYSLSLLTQAEPNIRMGTLYFKDKVDQFGGVYLALASYNAGEGRVSQWRREKPSLPQDEFIDDIPFPETQNYVKRILGTAEDYRRLYGGGLLDPNASLHVSGSGRPITAPKAASSPKTSGSSDKVRPTSSKGKKSTAKKPTTRKPSTTSTRSKTRSSRR